MEKRGTVVIAVASLLAIIAGLAVFVFLKDSSSDSSASEGQVKVLVATRNLDVSTKASQLIDTGAVKVVARKISDVPEDALHSVADLSKLATQNLVLASGIPETTALRQSSFIEPGGGSASLNGALAADEQFVTIPGSYVRGLSAGLLKPGDHVNIIMTGTSYTGEIDASGTTSADDTNALPVASTGYLFQDLEVYAIGSTTATTPAGSSDTSAAAATVVTGTEVTFRVNLVQATKLIAAIHGGAQPAELWLTLVSQDFEAVPSPVLSFDSLFTDDYAKGAAAKEPATPAIPVKPTASSSTTSAAGN